MCGGEKKTANAEKSNARWFGPTEENGRSQVEP